MKDFVDLKGASGASYRFRRQAHGQPYPRMAGNYAALKPRSSGFVVIHVGVTNDLSQARTECPPEALGGSTALYIRLNVSRAVREAEHADLLANYSKAVGGPDS